MAAAEGEAFPYWDARLPVEERISDLLSRMTLAEKIGQMTQIDRTVAAPHVIRDFYIGSVLNGPDQGLPPEATPSMWADMIDAHQAAAMSTRLGIPIIYGSDAVHGNNNVFGSTIFPHNIGLGAARDEDLMIRIGEATALEARACGIHYAFAPCLAVSRDPRWGRCYESFSEDAGVVKAMAKLILGLQGSPPQNYLHGYPFISTRSPHVVACAKHFVGDGGTVGGVNEHNTISSYSDLYNIHMSPYIDALKMGVSTIMVSHSSWNGDKMHAHFHLLTDVLKKEMGFQGFLISDWEGIDRLSTPPSTNYKENVAHTINAGIDMAMVPFSYPKFISSLTDLVLSGTVSLERIDDAVRRILRVKFVAGLFEKPLADRSLVKMVGCQEHRQLSREAARKSLVLLKNGKDGEPLLPLNKSASKILVAGTHAHDIGYQCGGWTITLMGGKGNTTTGTTILEGIKNAVSHETKVVFEETPDEFFFKDNKGFDFGIVVVGEVPYAETAGDNKELFLSPESGEIIRRICSKLKCLVILISGRPLVIEPYNDVMDALVVAWLPGSEGGNGIADVIFGDYNFSGKLPRTWFRHVDQLPINVGDSKYDPLYQFGYGLDMKI